MPRGDDAKEARPVTWSQVHAFRMARHHLDRPVAKARLVRAVADAGGIQAQVMAAAQLALRVRVRGLVPEDIDRALWRDHSLTRVWCMRGTVHIIPSGEFSVFVRGSSSRQEGRVANWMARSGAPTASVERLVRTACAAMDRPRTRGEIVERVRGALGWPVEKAGGRGWGNPADAAGFRIGRTVLTVPDIAWLAAYRGLVCFGPDEGRGSTFVRPDAWLPGWRDVPVAEAEDGLLRRHLRAFGPATVSDFAMWTILTLKRAHEVWSRLEDELRPVSVEGRTAWVLGRDLAALERAKLPGRVVRLIPYFDSYLMGHKGRDHLVDGAHYKRIYRPAGWVYPAVLVDGRVAGEWSYERKARRLDVRVRPYEPLDGESMGLVRDEVEDVARFLGAPEARTVFARAR